MKLTERQQATLLELLGSHKDEVTERYQKDNFVHAGNQWMDEHVHYLDELIDLVKSDLTEAERIARRKLETQRNLRMWEQERAERRGYSDRQVDDIIEATENALKDMDNETH